MKAHFYRQLPTAMSYFYESTADDYSAPIDSLPLWETVGHEQDLTLSSQQQQPSEEEQPSKNLLSSIFQFVDLGDKPLELERDDASNSEIAHSTPQQVTEASKAIRSARSKSQSANPYQHPRSPVPGLSSSGPGPGIRNVSRPLRFVHHNLIPPTTLSSTLFNEGVSTSTSVTPSARHSPVMSAPGSVNGYETLSATRDLIFCSHITQFGIQKCWQYSTCTIPIATISIIAYPTDAKFFMQPLTINIWFITNPTAQKEIPD